MTPLRVLDDIVVKSCSSSYNSERIVCGNIGDNDMICSIKLHRLLRCTYIVIITTRCSRKWYRDFSIFHSIQQIISQNKSRAISFALRISQQTLISDNILCRMLSKKTSDCALKVTRMSSANMTAGWLQAVQYLLPKADVTLYQRTHLNQSSKQKPLYSLDL